MNWADLVAMSHALSMPGLVAYMERWQPGSTSDLLPATAEQIAALAAPHGGIHVLPSVYRAFLETMGESMGTLRFRWRTTAISELLEDLEDLGHERHDPRRYLKFSIGEEDYNGRHPDDFFDLARRTSDNSDAAVIRIHEKDLVSGKNQPDEPFPSFSDLLRRVIAVKLGLEGTPEYVSFWFGRNPDALPKTFELLLRLGFGLTELGASTSVVPLEHYDGGAVALLRGPSGEIRDTGLRLRVVDPKQSRMLQEILRDHKLELRGI